MVFRVNSGATWPIFVPRLGLPSFSVEEDEGENGFWSARIIPTMTITAKGNASCRLTDFLGADLVGFFFFIGFT